MASYEIGQHDGKFFFGKFNFLLLQFDFYVSLVLLKYLGTDYIESFNPGWSFNSVYWVEISSSLNGKLLC